MTCPICNSPSFDAYGGRETARCMGCGALERGRLSWLALERLGLLRPGLRMLNMAPEPFMLFHGAKVIGAGYRAADYDPGLFEKWGMPVAKLDLCDGLTALPESSFDVVMHNHVLEHLPCDVATVLAGLNRILAPGGIHLFSAPIMPDRNTTEDLNPALPPAERQRRFGQDDHMRLFGDRDFLDIVARAMLLGRMIDLSLLIRPEALAKAAIPADVFSTLGPHRVFAWRKDVAASSVTPAPMQHGPAR